MRGGTFEEGGGGGTGGRFLLRSDAEFLMERPVSFLVLRETVVGLATTGALVGRGLGASRKGAGRGGFGRGRGFGLRLARFHFGGRWGGVEGIAGGLLCYLCT